MWRIAGAILIIAGCGLAGFRTALAYRSEIRDLEQCGAALEYIKNDLQFRLMPLPDLCRNAAQNADGCVRDAFLTLSEELESQLCPDVQSCMYATLSRIPQMSRSFKKVWNCLMYSLGKFDVSGQISALESVIKICQDERSQLADHQNIRFQNYQTMGLCAGAVLAILLI